jgi:predicted nucleic acid-binding protein
VPTPALLGEAAALPPPSLRSLDAIHLATAAALGPELTAFLVHDDRLTAAAIRAAPPVARPA